MSNSPIPHLEKMFQEFEKEYEKYKRDEILTLYHEHQYRMTGEVYMNSGPYHADHEKFELQRAVWKSALTGLKVQAEKCVNFTEQMLKETLAHTKQDYADNKELITIYNSASLIQTKRRVREVLNYCYIFFVLAIFGLVIIGVMFPIPSLTQGYLLPVAGIVAVVSFILSFKYYAPTTEAFAEEVLRYVKARKMSPDELVAADSNKCDD